MFHCLGSRAKCEILQRQGLAYILVRQATSLLQRTKLNVVVSCQAWHAKNARHMLLGEFNCVYDYLLNIFMVIN